MAISSRIHITEFADNFVLLPRTGDAGGATARDEDCGTPPLDRHPRQRPSASFSSGYRGAWDRGTYESPKCALRLLPTGASADAETPTSRLFSRHALAACRHVPNASPRTPRWASAALIEGLHSLATEISGRARRHAVAVPPEPIPAPAWHIRNRDVGRAVDVCGAVQTLRWDMAAPPPGRVSRCEVPPWMTSAPSGRVRRPVSRARAPLAMHVDC